LPHRGAQPGRAHVYVHRDFMPRNLMPRARGRAALGVLDFQDAVYGPITYDIASLMRDAFLSWDEDFVLDITVRYWQQARKAGLPVGDDFGEFYRAVEWMGLQRHLKVAGIFARLTLRDGKPKYLADAPRFIALHPPATASRCALHVQVLRLQPGDGITLFGGLSGLKKAAPAANSTPPSPTWAAARCACTWARTTPSSAKLPRTVHLLAGITANERMDWLVEKATELGVASITPLLAERSVLKLKGERADKKIAHWQAVAVAACEQCGRNRCRYPRRRR
jgi:hypothetical protein